MFHSLQEEWPPRGFKLADFLKFLKLGLTEITSASGRRPRVRAVYPSLVRRGEEEGPMQTGVSQLCYSLEPTEEGGWPRNAFWNKTFCIYLFVFISWLEKNKQP